MSVPSTPPVRPGKMTATRPAIWPRVLAVWAWMGGAGSIALAIAAMGYPYLAAWMTAWFTPSHDDLAGVLSKRRGLDLAVEGATLAMAVWLIAIGVSLWRRRAGSARRLRWWCVARLVLVALNLSLLYVQASEHFGAREDLQPGQQNAHVLGFLVWGALLGLPGPAVVLSWLCVGSVRRNPLMTGRA